MPEASFREDPLSATCPWEICMCEPFSVKILMNLIVCSHVWGLPLFSGLARKGTNLVASPPF
jgi:hypothetical protein